ncbi:4-(cytidine 5'-diphospho)-2-C-methyl-D-erythritol kinase [Pseudaminobacter sp. NGMCC 1.201702]|uniref:4-(cytidine 5'-diphospho)-2-C-methyl-D-erythritol kinase n=1 Tax=Pseudaminobacter sp. NGMCC 1.201702 TaxID=3391825 RepID=UPI0039EDF1F2
MTITILNSAACIEDAPAKINLALHVTGQRQDGYHLIESLAVFSRYGDRVTVTAAREDSFSVAGPFAAQIPLDAGNLAMRARDALRRTVSSERTMPVAILLEKNLPVASGIGGGSSDAAATLRALARHWNIKDDLSELALRLGADVPMCLVGRPLVASGIGEIVEPVAMFPQLHLVLVNPGVEIATPDVFRALQNRQNPPLPPLPEDRGVTAVVKWLGKTRNDLEVPARAVAPTIGDALTALGGAGALLARMSGSGATCFGLFETQDAARRAAGKIRDMEPGWFVVATSSTP